MILYHWTPRRNLSSIYRSGLDPAKATGNLQVVWLADRERSFGLLDCASKVHQLPPRAFCLLRVTVDPKPLQRWRFKGVYRSLSLIPAAQLEWVSVQILWDHSPLRIRGKSG